MNSQESGRNCWLGDPKKFVDAEQQCGSHSQILCASPFAGLAAKRLSELDPEDNIYARIYVVYYYLRNIDKGLPWLLVRN